MTNSNRHMPVEILDCSLHCVQAMGTVPLLGRWSPLHCTDILHRYVDSRERKEYRTCMNFTQAPGHYLSTESLGGTSNLPDRVEIGRPWPLSELQFVFLLKGK